MMQLYVRLFRPKLSLLNGVTAVSGYLLFPSAIQSFRIIALFSAVALLAAGGSALNQLMEVELDSRMVRTRERPLPMKALTPLRAVVAGSVVIIAGTLLLIVCGGLLPALLGCAALLWYLAVYTPLKRRTSLALPVGALCGAFPPLIGWSLAGGSISDYRAVILAGLMFLWQIPHFWLFQRRHEEEYRLAGIPFFNVETKGSGRKPFLLLWIVALTAAAMLLPAFGMLEQPTSVWYALFPASLVVVCIFGSQRLLFPTINFFPLLLALLLLIHKSC